MEGGGGEESNIESPLLPQGRTLRNSENVALSISSDFCDFGRLETTQTVLAGATNHS